MNNVKYYNLRTPVTAQLELTSKCTNRCVYCYNSWRYDTEIKEKELSLSEFMIIANKFIKSEIFEVVFTGGEPLLRKDVLYPLIKKMSKEGVITKINSNLVLLDDEDIRRIKDLQVEGVLTSISSYDGKKHNRICGTNSFNRVISNLEKLILENISSGVSMVILENNKNDVYKTGKFLHENVGLKIFCATPISPCSSTHKGLEIKPSDIEKVLEDLILLRNDFNMDVDVLEPIPLCIIKDIKKYTSFLERDCSAGRLTVTVSPSGDVRPCTHVSKKYGNLLNESMRAIWLNMYEWRSGSFVPDKCKDCGMIFSCSLGCREAAYTHFDDYKAEDPWTVGYNPLDKFDINDNKETFSETDKFTITSGIKYRKENGNYVLFSSSYYTMAIVNEPLFSIISNLNSLKSFSIKQIVELWNIGDRDKVYDLFKFLKQKKFISKV